MNHEQRRPAGKRTTSSRAQHVVREPPHDQSEFGDAPPHTDEPEEPDEPSELEAHDAALIDDIHWETFIADDDERDPIPEPGDFWIEQTSE